MPQGTVKWFNAEKGFGFIAPEDGSAECRRLLEIQASGFRTLERPARRNRGRPEHKRPAGHRRSRRRIVAREREPPARLPKTVDAGDESVVGPPLR